jgi:uncharacterized protein (TIGR02246 family)
MQVLNAAALFLALLPATAAQDVVRIDPSTAASSEPDLEALRQQYAAAVNARDVQQTASLYAADALATFDGTVVRGSDAIAHRLGQPSTPGAVITLLPRHFSSSSAVASETGTFVETRPGPDRTVSVEGVYVTVYARGADGLWRIAMEVRATGSTPAPGVW